MRNVHLVLYVHSVDCEVKSKIKMFVPPTLRYIKNRRVRELRPKTSRCRKFEKEQPTSGNHK
jgi:hypothetical protein